MSVIGIDFGNDKCVVAVARRRGIDVVLNQGESKREIPSVVSFSDRHRLIGSTAAATNPANSITQIKRLIGRTFSDLEHELHLLPFKVTEDPRGLPLINVCYLNEDQAFTPTQVLGMLLSHLKALAESHLGSPVSNCCIGVPAFFTNGQRRAVLDAAAIAGLRPLRLVHEATAVALEYGIYKEDLPGTGRKTRNVAFVDVGHASVQACVVGYRKGQLRLMAHAFDRSLGGRDFDEVLFGYFAGKFKEKTTLDLSGNARSQSRLRKACEKLKKILSSNSTATLHVDCLVRDRDFRGSMKREEFERMSGSLLERVKVTLERAIREAGIRVEDIDVVEVVGSGSRVPAIVGILTEYFGKEPRRTLNASECVARGCALQCAMLSPAFRVREFEVHDNFPFAVDVLWRHPLTPVNDSDDHPDPSSHVIVRGDRIPDVKYTPRHAQVFGDASFLVDVAYADTNEPGGHRTISTYEIGPSPLTEGGSAAFQLGIRLDLHGIVSLCSATMVEEVDAPTSTVNAAPEESSEMDIDGAQDQCKPEVNSSEWEVVDGARSTPQILNAPHADILQDQENTNALAENNPTDIETSVKTVKETKRINVDFVEFIHGATSPEKLQEAIKNERKMDLWDKLMKETEDRKNAVETYVYDMRKKIRAEYRNFVEDQERELLSAKLQQIEDWLYGEGEDVTKDDYSARLEELKRLGDPIEMRYREDLHRDQAVTQLLECILWYQQYVMSTDTRLDYINFEEKKEVFKACLKTEEWLMEKEKLQNCRRQYEDPVLVTSEISQEHQALDRYCRSILTKRRPDPPKKQTTESRETPISEPAARRQQVPASCSSLTQQKPPSVNADAAKHLQARSKHGTYNQ